MDEDWENASLTEEPHQWGHGKIAGIRDAESYTLNDGTKTHCHLNEASGTDYRQTSFNSLGVMRTSNAEQASEKVRPDS